MTGFGEATQSSDRLTAAVELRAVNNRYLKVTLRANELEEADSAALRDHGFSDDDIWDIAAIAAFFGMSNRMANVTSLRPNDEFYAMGRG